MALNAYISSIKADKQGQIKGNVTQKGREGWIEVIAYHHGIKSPRDVATGQATGKRQHGQLNITKQIDKSTPLLFNALITNENLKEVVIKFFMPSQMGSVGGGGVEKNTFTITLTNAVITSINEELLLTSVAENKSLPIMEQVCFVYQKIEWTWVDGGITAMDDWQNPA